MEGKERGKVMANSIQASSMLHKGHAPHTVLSMHRLFSYLQLFL
jgi:hypothetical protein